MQLDNASTVWTFVAAAAASAILLAVSWDIGHGRRRALRRAAVAVACVLSAVTVAGLELNRLTDTYPSWAALAGANGPAGQAPTTDDPAPTALSDVPASVPRPLLWSVPAAASRGRVLATTIVGHGTGITMPAYVYLPAAYTKTSARDNRFPVIEALHGYPSSPQSWLRRLHVSDYLDKEIAAGRMAPTVVVFPYQTPRALLDTECTNLRAGPQAETYLTRDVPAQIEARYRVRTDRAAWGLIGYSAGGFCATNLALRHPDKYAAAASLSGYATPGITVGDGSEHTTNNPAWRLRNLAQPPLRLYLAYANDDRHCRRDNLQLTQLAGSPLDVTTAVVANGGHSDAVWQQMEGPAFDWLSSWLARPTTT